MSDAYIGFGKRDGTYGPPKPEPSRGTSLKELDYLAEIARLKAIIKDYEDTPPEVAKRGGEAAPMEDDRIFGRTHP